MSKITRTTEAELILPGKGNGITAKVRWVVGTSGFKIHQDSGSIMLNPDQLRQLVEVAPEMIKDLEGTSAE